jgi:SAM-dependent methyltransferase
LGLATKLKLVADNGAELLLEHPSWRCLANDSFMNLQALVSAVAEYRGLSEFEPPPRQADPWSNSLDVFQYAMALLAPGRILEIGSRARSGIVRRQLFGALDYTGMDVLAGPNVDLVGDAHQLGAYFKADCFDFIMSVSVFEHLMKPWRVVEQMNRVLKPGGLVMINTHQSWPVHDAPWDFHRFSEFSWVSLFNEQSGFEIIQAVMGEPCIIVPTQLAEGYRGLQQQRGFLSSRCIARKTAEADRSDLSRPDTRVYPSYPA